MANINALIKSWDRKVRDATTYLWVVNFNCMPLSGGQFTGEDFDYEVKVPVAIGDTSAQVKTKILDALSTYVAQRQSGDVVTVVQGIDLARWL